MDPETLAKLAYNQQLQPLGNEIPLHTHLILYEKMQNLHFINIRSNACFNLSLTGISMLLVAGLASALDVNFSWLMIVGSDCLLATFDRSMIVGFWSEMNDDLISFKRNDSGFTCERNVKNEISSTDLALRDLVAIFGNGWDGILARPWLNRVSFFSFFYVVVFATPLLLVPWSGVSDLRGRQGPSPTV